MGIVNKDEYKWVTETLDNSNDPSDWKQGLATLAFITTESYGKGVKEELFIPYLEKAVNHTNIQIKKLGIRFTISFKALDLLQGLDQNVLAETFHEKFFRFKKDTSFLKSLKITFKKLKKEKKLDKFLNEIAWGKFSDSIVKELTFQLWYRDVHKIEEALDVIHFLFEKLSINKENFIPIINNFIKDLDKRIYLQEKKEVKQQLKDKALEIINKEYF